MFREDSVRYHVDGPPSATSRSVEDVAYLVQNNILLLRISNAVTSSKT